MPLSGLRYIRQHGTAAYGLHSCVWQARGKRRRGSFCNLQRGRQMRVHQGSCPDGSMGSVFFNGRRRGPAAQGRRTARACSLGAGERRYIKLPEISAPALHPPLNAVRPGEARRGPRGDGGSRGNKGTCCHKGACSDDDEACGDGQERDDDAGKLPPRLHSPLWPFLTCYHLTLDRPR